MKKLGEIFADYMSRTHVRRDVSFGCYLYEVVEGELAAQAAELAQAREVLRGMEWDSWGYDRFGEGRAHCPCCGCTKDEGHAPDCALSAALSKKGE